MVGDLKTAVPNVKCVDDTFFIEIVTKGQPSIMPDATDDILDWSKQNDLAINTTKTKELISFGKDPEVPPLVMDGTVVERVTQT